MRNIVSAYVERFLHDRRERLKFGGIVLLLAVIVAGIVFWRLSYVGVAMTNEIYCGMEEHQHDSSCYTEVLACGLEGSAGSEGHTHEFSCYETVTELVCGREESAGHIHDDSCFDGDGNLICAITESEGHTHTDTCYETTRILICGLDEVPAAAGHIHDGSCYEEILVCGLAEHTHSMECMIDETADVETAEDWEAALPVDCLTGIWAEDVVIIAESQLGYTESAANFRLDEDGETKNGYTRYGAWYGNAYGNWDALFVSFCLYYAGIPETAFPYNSGAYAWSAALEKEGLYENAPDHTPEPGDLVFLNTEGDEKADTVALVTDIDGEAGALLLIQGDCRGEVAAYTIPADDDSILGYGVLPEQPEGTAETDDDEDPIDGTTGGEDEMADEITGAGEEGSDASEEIEGKDPGASGESGAEASEEILSAALTFEGEDYIISVTFGPEAGLPEDVYLYAFEYGADSETYAVRRAEAAELYGWGDDDAGENGSGREEDIRLFNIGLYVTDEEGEITEVEPAAPVEVTIAYPEETEDNGFAVAHFGPADAEDLEVSSFPEDGACFVTFTLDSFSDIMVLANQNVTVVLNLGNISSSTAKNLHYAADGTYMRYSATIRQGLSNSTVTVYLPCDDDLGKSFTVGYNQNNRAVTVNLGREWAYDYKLVGWIDIATGIYYDVSDGPAEAEVSTSGSHVFYADWIAADYDQGVNGTVDDASVVETEDTSSFVTLELYDFNELFNMYSTTLTQNGTDSETWSFNSDGSSYFYSYPLLRSSYPTGYTAVYGMTLFDHSTIITSNSSLGNMGNRGSSTGNKHIATEAGGAAAQGLVPASQWGISSPNAAILAQIFSRDNGHDPENEMYGVYYVGDANYLFQFGTEGSEGKNADTAKYVGYYYYESDLNAAVYNQTDGRFYVYDRPQYMWSSGNPVYTGFLPFNRYQLDTSAAEGNSCVYYDAKGTTDYWFGMKMTVDFYLPGSVGNSMNKVENADMVFNFSGDDDILVFVDDILVLDMAGIHDSFYGSINFATGVVTVENRFGVSETRTITGFNAAGSVMASGTHTLTVYYMERGAGASNLGISFNITPYWEYETGPLQTIYARKVWKIRGSEEDLDGSMTEGFPSVAFGLFQVVDAQRQGQTNTWIYNGETYQLDADNCHKDAEFTIDAFYDSAGEKFYIRTDLRELSYSEELGAGYWDPVNGELVNSYGWYWSWEYLDPEGEYIVLELTEDAMYASSESYTDQNGFYYWTIIGGSEIEEMLNTQLQSDGTIRAGETVGMVILTDGAQHIDSGSGTSDPSNKNGYVVVARGEGNNAVITGAEAVFSQGADVVKREIGGVDVYSGVYGAVGGNTVAGLDGSAVWYMETTGQTLVDDLDGTVLHLFRLYYSVNDTRYYLTEVSEGRGGYTLALTESRDSAAMFYDDAMGELRIHISVGGEQHSTGDYRIVIDADTGAVSVSATNISSDDGHNVKIYTWNESGSSGYIFTLNNAVNPDVTIEKVDAADPGKKLENAVFVLGQIQNADTAVAAEEFDILWYHYDGAGNTEGGGSGTPEPGPDPDPEQPTADPDPTPGTEDPDPEEPTPPPAETAEPEPDPEETVTIYIDQYGWQGQYSAPASSHEVPKGSSVEIHIFTDTSWAPGFSSCQFSYSNDGDPLIEDTDSWVTFSDSQHNKMVIQIPGEYVTQDLYIYFQGDDGAQITYEFYVNGAALTSLTSFKEVLPLASGGDGNSSGLTWAEGDKNEAATRVVTDADGKAVFRYLEDGTYYLEEIVPPEGYSVLFEYLVFTVQDGKITSVSVNGADPVEPGSVSGSVSWDSGSMTITVANGNAVALPRTGGAGTWVFLIAGFAMVSAAVGILYRTRRGKGEDIA